MVSKGQSLGVGRLREGMFAPGRESTNGAVGRWVGGWVTPKELALWTKTVILFAEKVTVGGEAGLEKGEELVQSCHVDLKHLWDVHIEMTRKQLDI